jgi:hypothetical protein
MSLLCYIEKQFFLSSSSFVVRWRTTGQTGAFVRLVPETILSN